jgi:hypothetical protein
MQSQDYPTKKEFEELRGKIDANKQDFDSFKASVIGDVVTWSSPLIHIVAGDIVNFLVGNQGKRPESIRLEYSKKNEPFPYPRIEKAAAKCSINFHDFRRACDRSRVERNRTAHAHDLEDLALKVFPVQELFNKYPFLKQREADQYLLISNFDRIKDVMEDLESTSHSNNVVA